MIINSNPQKRIQTVNNPPVLKAPKIGFSKTSILSDFQIYKMR